MKELHDCGDSISSEDSILPGKSLVSENESFKLNQKPKQFSFNKPKSLKLHGNNVIISLMDLPLTLNLEVGVIITKPSDWMLSQL